MNDEDKKIKEKNIEQDLNENQNFPEDDYDKSKQDLERILSELQAKMNDNNQNVKIIKVMVPTKKERIINLILTYIISFVVVSGLSGYIHWITFEKFYYVLIMAGLIPAVELFIEFIIEKFFFKYILYSFGMILIVAPLISFVFLALVLPFITIEDWFLTFLVIVLYMIVKKIILTFVKGLKKKDYGGKVI